MVDRTKTKRKTKSKTKILIPILSLLLLTGCANQLPPGGGDVDTIPPKIEEIYPPNGTIKGQHNFASTYNQHLNNVNKFRRWLKEQKRKEKQKAKQKS